MKVHVLPGDSIVTEFRKANSDSDIIVCRECLIAGDVDADSLPEFWDQRARFIASAFGEDEIEYHEKVADELARLIDLDVGTEVNLWFEYELFCSANLWFCLYLLQETGTEVYRVEPSVLTARDRWKGFGRLGEDDLQRCFEQRKKLTPEEVKHGADLWNAYRHGDDERLRELSKSGSDRFPYLEEICEAAIDKETRPLKILQEIREDGLNTLDEIFPEFVKRAGEYGFGDTQIEHMLQKIS